MQVSSQGSLVSPNSWSFPNSDYDYTISNISPSGCLKYCDGDGYCYDLVGNETFSSSQIQAGLHIKVKRTTCGTVNFTYSYDNGVSEDLMLSTNDISPVVNGLFGVVGEFIPYMVYISIGLLLSTLGFYAIKWLCNWFYNKILSIFKK